MSCSDKSLAERCVNNPQACKVCTNRVGFVESYNWFYDKADYEKMTATDANQQTKEKE